MEKKIIVIRGGGDVASGVAACLWEAGFGVVITELSQPLVVRRKVSFAEAVWEEQCQVEGIPGRRAAGFQEARQIIELGEVAVLVDPDGACVDQLDPIAIVDGRILKRPITNDFGGRRVIGLGPGFTAGQNCWVAIETQRGENLGRIYLEGSPEPDTGAPAVVMGYSRERVQYSSRAGIFHALVEIGDFVEAGQELAEIDGEPVRSQIGGVVRGLLRDGIWVGAAVKVGDVDPTGERELCYRISDKARTIGAAVVDVLRRLERE